MSETNTNHDNEMRIQMLIDHCMPMNSDLDSIKLKTYDKIQRHNLSRRRHRWLVAVMGIAACALLALLIGLGHDRMTATDSSTLLANAQTDARDEAPVAMRSVSVPSGRRLTLRLNDGSRIVANARSRVEWPARFAADSREIYVHGEVYIEAAHDATRPMTVRTDGFLLRVLGTRFSVYDYDRSRSCVVLAEGQVEVTTAHNDKVKMKPGQLLTVENGDITNIDHVCTSDYLLWTDGLLPLNGEDIYHVVSRIQHYYDVPIVCAPNLPRHQLYGKLELKRDAADVLRSLQSLAHIQVDEQGARRIGISK